MKRRKDCEYMFLDGMPVVIGPDKTPWVFADSTHTWMEIKPGNRDSASIVYPNRPFWNDFANLPEPPIPPGT